MTDFETYRNIINKHLDEYTKIKYPETIWESMKYSLCAGGKRLRPVIVIDVCNTICGKYEHAIPTACAIEMLHTYSLIHDDLPCMDNDDYRRGKLTNHKVYGEAIALLAGDALLTYAPQIIIQKTPETVKKETILKILETFFVACGATGMVAGQVVDLQSEGKKIDKSTLQYMHNKKTAELFKFSFTAGGLLADADDLTLHKLDNIATNIGLAFQIADDILDVIATKEELGKTPGKDLKEQKATFVTFYGLEQAKQKLREICDRTEAELEKTNLNSVFLKELIKNIRI